jgi:hypothetical protein
MRAKDGNVSPGELGKVAGILAGDRGGPETYRLLYVLGRSRAYAYEELVARFLEYREDPMVARLALQILCSFWGRTDRYRDAVERFLDGVDWDYLRDVREIAISAAGSFLAGHRDCGLLARLLRLSDPAHDHELERRFATEAIARAIGLTHQQITSRDSGDGGSLSRDEWAETIRSRGEERFAAECMRPDPPRKTPGSASP